MMLFEPESHIYSIEGRVIPGTTNIISDSCPFVDYSGTGEVSGTFGHNFHKATELYDKNDLGEYDPAMSNHMDAYKQFRQDFIYLGEPIFIEKILYSIKHGYAGTIDRVFQRGREIYQIDLKSGAFSPKWFIQTAAYQNLLIEELNDKRLKYFRWCLQITEQGYKIFKPKNIFIQDFNIFISMKNVSNWKKENKIK